MSTSATAIDPRVAEQMLLIKERKAAEAAAAQAAREAAEALFAHQVEEGKIIWEAELRIEMESAIYDDAAKAKLLAAASGSGCCISRTWGYDPRRSHHPVCPYGPGGAYYNIETDTTRGYTIQTDGTRTPVPFRTVEEVKADFCYTWRRKELTSLIQKWQAEARAKADAEHRLKMEEDARRQKEALAAQEALKEKIVTRTQSGLSSIGIKCNLTPELVTFGGVGVYYVYYCPPGFRGSAEGNLQCRNVIFDYSGGERNSDSIFRGLNVPTSWNDHYSKGLIPFLPQCPVCSKQTVCGGEGNRVTSVSCSVADHYRWDPATNKHYKFTTVQIYPGADWSGMREWDPTDPDGSIAEGKRKAAEADDIQKQIAALQARLATLTGGGGASTSGTL